MQYCSTYEDEGPSGIAKVFIFFLFLRVGDCQSEEEMRKIEEYSKKLINIWEKNKENGTLAHPGLLRLATALEGPFLLWHQADTSRALSLFESYKGALKRLKLGLYEFTI